MTGQLNGWLNRIHNIYIHGSLLFFFFFFFFGFSGKWKRWWKCICLEYGGHFCVRWIWWCGGIVNVKLSNWKQQTNLCLSYGLDIFIQFVYISFCVIHIDLVIWDFAFVALGWFHWIEFHLDNNFCDYCKIHKRIMRQLKWNISLSDKI